MTQITQTAYCDATDTITATLAQPDGKVSITFGETETTVILKTVVRDVRFVNDAHLIASVLKTLLDASDDETDIVMCPDIDEPLDVVAA